jgi:signal transduction histidine kinase
MFVHLMVRSAYMAETVSRGDTDTGKSGQNRLDRLAVYRIWMVAGIVVYLVVMGAVVLTGWVLHIPWLKSMVPGWATMKVNTALSVIVAAGALGLLGFPEAGLAGARLGRVLAALLLLLGVASLAENLLSLDFGIDDLLIRARAGSSGRPGLMSPASALSFAFLGAALLNLRSGNAIRARLAQWFTVPPLLVATIGLFGYVAGVNSLYQVRPYASLAAHTIFALLSLAIGILGAEPRFGLTSIFLSDTAGGLVARRLLSSLPPAFFIIGAVGLAGQSAGYYDEKFCVAVIMITSMAVSMAAVFWTAYALRRIDLKRRATELELRAANAELLARGERLAFVQSELAHKARLSAMGEMAAALAHELNQPLTAVGTTVGAIELLLKDASKPVDDATRGRVLRAVRQAESQVIRAGDIIRRLRRFVSRGEVDAKPEHLLALIEEAVALALPNPESAGVAVRIEVAPEAERVRADRVQVQQVIVNLVRNAVEAMREQDGPRSITIDGTADGDMATVRVIDTGPGLAPEVGAGLFSAFFTTKSEGMGVGLSICRHLIETHGGRMWFEPSESGGADFRFTLPLSGGGAGSDPLHDGANST